MRNKKIEKIVVTLSVIFIAWLVLSFFNINAHNLTDQNYAKWNLFQLLF